jgi:hypothetical protein
MPAATINSARGLAIRVCRSHTAVIGWLKHPEWSFGRGPWKAKDVPKILHWAAVTLPPDPSRPGGDEEDSSPRAGIAAMTKSDAQKLAALARTEKTRVETQILKKQMHSVEACESRRLRQFEDLKRRFIDLPNALPFSAPDRKLVNEAILRILQDLADGR